MVDISGWTYTDYYNYAQYNYYDRGGYSEIRWVDNAKYFLTSKIAVPYWMIDYAEIMTETKEKGGATKTIAGALVGGALLGGIGAIAGAGAGLASGNNEYATKVYVRIYLTDNTYLDVNKRHLGTDTKINSRRFREAYADCSRVIDEIDFAVELTEMDADDFKAYAIQYHPDSVFYEKRKQEDEMYKQENYSCIIAVIAIMVIVLILAFS